MAYPIPGIARQATQPAPALALWRLRRPRQWVKNLLVFAPLIFAEDFIHLSAWPPTIYAFAAFCLPSSAIYTANDWHDREEDGRHPKKRSRPLASGQASLRAAAWLPGLLLALGLALAYPSSPTVMLTIPFVIYGLFRYLYLLSANDRAENPDELLVADWPTLLNLGLWGITVVIMFVLDRQGML